MTWRFASGLVPSTDYLDSINPQAIHLDVSSPIRRIAFHTVRNDMWVYRKSGWPNHLNG
jgi:hypothetical protein